jgi:hypothetical protein
MNIAMKAFKNATPDGDFSIVMETLRALDIPEDIIKTAKERVESESGVGR